MAKIGIFYGSTLGDTKGGAELIASKLDGAELVDVSGANKESLEAYDVILFGSSTWGLGELQDDWLSFIAEIDTYNFAGKKVAVFGYGDQESYPDTFVDAIGDIHDAAEKNGAEILGLVSTEGYNFIASKAVQDDMFVGLPLDEVNQSNLTEERINKWLEGIKSAF